MHLDWGTPVSETPPTERPPAVGAPTLRLVRVADGPTVSVVLATHKRRAELEEALAPLALFCGQIGAELIVIGEDAHPPQGRPLGRNARYVPASADMSMTQMRELAMSRCTGDIVVLLDDASPSSRSWMERVRASTRRIAERRGGDAARVSRGAVDWRAYLSSARAVRD